MIWISAYQLIGALALGHGAELSELAERQRGVVRSRSQRVIRAETHLNQVAQLLQLPYQGYAAASLLPFVRHTPAAWRSHSPPQIMGLSADHE